MEKSILFDKLYDKFEGFFSKNSFPSFNDILWQIVINEILKGRNAAITSVLTENGMELAIVYKGEKGYYPTHVLFNSDVTYNKAEEIANELNNEIFGLSPKDAIVLKLSTF
jgi:divalent metal cation (Fe/Co/Zn/Cd) transporter